MVSLTRGTQRQKEGWLSGWGRGTGIVFHGDGVSISRDDGFCGWMGDGCTATRAHSMPLG